MIMFTQYLRPDGRPRPCKVERPPQIEALAHELQAAGVKLEAEVLTTNEVSLTAEREGDDGELDVDGIEVVPNGPEVPGAVDRLITTAHGQLCARKMSDPPEPDVDEDKMQAFKSMARRAAKSQKE